MVNVSKKFFLTWKFINDLMIDAWFQQNLFIYMIPEDHREFLMYDSILGNGVLY